MLPPILLHAHNPSPTTGAGNNTFLLRAGNGSALLVDAGVGASDHLDLIDRTLAEHGARLAMVVVTHAHPDHAAGIVHVAARHPSAALLKIPGPRDSAYAVPWRSIGDGDRLVAGDIDLRVVWIPGHSPDHLALWHGPSRSLFSGDLAVPGSSVMIDASGGGDLQQYLASLRLAIDLKPRLIYPGHGAVVDDPEALLVSYLRHRELRERQVVEALAAGQETVESIADSIYDRVAPALARACRETVSAHLWKLKNEGRAAEQGGRWTLRLG